MKTNLRLRLGVFCGLGLISLAACSEDRVDPIVVTPEPVASVELTPATGTIAVGGSLLLTATPKDAAGRALTDRVVTWESSDTGIATVTMLGMVAGVSPGNVLIKAISESKEATASLVVSAGPPVPPGPGPSGFAPSLITYVGGSGDSDMVRDVATDGLGNFYVVGGTNSPDFAVTPGAFDVTFNNPGSTDQDAFVQKRSASGQVVWSTYIGGSGYDRAYAVEVDAQGFVYVAGRAGAGLPVTQGALQTTFAGSAVTDSYYGEQDGFLCKLRPDGSSVVFCTYFGNDDGAPIRDIVVDNAGNVYLATSCNRGVFPTSWFANAYQKTRSGGRDMLVVKVDATGSHVDWATYVGGSADELNTNSIRLDAAGNVYALTTTRSADAPTPNGFSHTLRGQSDLYVAKLSPDGSNLLYGTYIGGSGGDFTETHEMWVTPQGEAVVAATTTSRDFPTSPGSFQPTFQGQATSSANGAGANYPGDGMVLKLSSDGSRVIASTYLGGQFGDGIEGVQVNDAGEVFVSGTTFSPNFPTTDGKSVMGSSDMFVAKLAPDLSRLIAATVVGGSSAETTRSMTIDAAGNVYFVGISGSGNLPVMNATQSARGRGDDGSLVKLVPK